MKASIQMKLLILCIILVFLTTTGISVTYYVLIKQDKHWESQQRIRIAFDIILDDLENQIQFYARKFDEFLRADPILIGATETYNRDQEQLRDSSFIVTYLARVAESLKKFGYDISAHQITLYGVDKRLLAVYQRHDDQEVAGVYVTSDTNTPTFLLLGDPSQPVTSQESSQTISSILFSRSVPDNPLPPDIEASYEDTIIPDSIVISPFSRESRFGIHIIAPVFHKEDIIGVLIGEVLYTQGTVERYASLSKADVNFFGGNLLSVGTLTDQTELELEELEQMVSCEDIMNENVEIEIASLTFDEQDYYQGRCTFKSDQGRFVGATTVSLSQEIEKQAIRKVLMAILTISAIAIGASFGLSLLFSRKPILAIHDIVSVIVAAAEGDLRKTALVMSRDEIGMLATKLNQMITQLRTLSGQVQGSAYTVNGTADTILQQMDTLIYHMEQQSTSVDNTTSSAEKIKQFIDTVARNISVLLSAAAQILASIQETRASIAEVTTSTGSLTANLHLISASIDQVNQAVKQIAEHTGQLEEVTQQTETEINHIDHSLRDVSHNADRAQQLAKETMDAATSGQTSVEASIRGMTELKEVVSNTAQIIREVNSWGARVSSILGIVDEITEQTSLLALNASIISAQAGVHGRGFGVVADEIKELATRTKTSTQEIGTLIRELRMKTGEGVRHMAEGLKKTDEEMELARAVKEALNTILERATRSSKRAADTAQVIQQTVDSSHTISAQMNSVTDMVSKIKVAIQEQETDVEQVVSAVENISGMAEQVNRANLEQKRAAEEIEHSMEDVTEQFSDLSEQTEALLQNSDQIVNAMHTIESTTEQILQNATDISREKVKNLVQQSDVLQKIVNVFKIS